MSVKGETIRSLFRSAENLSVRRMANLLAPLGITPNQSEVLLVLDKYAPLTLKELGNLLICEEKSPSRLVQSLIKKGLVVGQTNQADKRSRLLSLTAKGKSLIEPANQKKAQFDAELLAKGFDLEALRDILQIYVEGSFYEEKLRKRSLW
ncbi:MarR family winged helix-turn-helix transcriptional regulator [Streptococcus sobrinus]|uniref:MarR family winged helix-turn-helix transcriptional regulator n=1 Tax=Streptococcus sobrinus TaxID=1310 RepID=UPI0002F5CC85|nr:winged helix DNA-binding protein [Streptococcus sobrinus]AWN19431.1 MarR family transcriptional regulator [Streptococcus sobrinus]